MAAATFPLSLGVKINHPFLLKLSPPIKTCFRNCKKYLANYSTLAGNLLFEQNHLLGTRFLLQLLCWAPTVPFPPSAPPPQKSLRTDNFLSVPFLIHKDQDLPNDLYIILPPSFHPKVRWLRPVHPGPVRAEGFGQELALQVPQVRGLRGVAG